MMRRCWMFMFLVLSISLLGAGIARAQDNGSTRITVDVTPGYHFVGHNDEMTKVGEYESLSSGAQGEVKAHADIGQFNADVHAFYYDEDEKDWSAFLDFGRVLQLDYSYDSFLHRLQHDNMHKDMSAQDVTNVLVPNQTLYPGVTWGDLGVHKRQSGKFSWEDLDVGKDYQIMRSHQQADFRMRLPFFPYIVPEVKLSEQTKRGWRQTTFMDSKCGICHVLANGRRVNEHTRTVSAGLNLRYGILTASYFHTWRHFDNEAGTPTHHFSELMTPAGKPAWITDRLTYEGSEAKYAEVPDVRKESDKVKVRLDLPYNTTLYASYVNSEVENNYIHKEYNTDVYVGRLTTTLLNDALTVTLKGRYYTIDNDDYQVDIESYSNNTTLSPSDPAYGSYGSVSYFDYERKSNLDRDVTELGFDFLFRLAARYSLRGGYEYKLISRDNKVWKDYDSPDLWDEEFLKDEDTTIHKVKLTLLGIPLDDLNFRLTYRYIHEDDPFENHNGICLEHRVLDYNVPYIFINRNQYRTKDATNVPDDTHDVRLVVNWAPSKRYSLSANLKYKYEKNDDSDWEGETYKAGINLWLAPLAKLVVNMGANYEYNTYETRYALNLFVGGGSATKFGDEQVAAACDKIDYDIHNFVAYINADFTPIDALRLFADATYTYSKADADDPNFPDVRDILDSDYQLITYPGAIPGPYQVDLNTTDMNGMSNWYDLKMERVDLSAGFEWNLWRSFFLTTRFTYRWYNDEEEYLDEDTDGEAYILSSGITWRF